MAFLFPLLIGILDVCVGGREGAVGFVALWVQRHARLPPLFTNFTFFLAVEQTSLFPHIYLVLAGPIVSEDGGIVACVVCAMCCASTFFFLPYQGD